MTQDPIARTEWRRLYSNAERCNDEIAMEELTDAWDRAVDALTSEDFFEGGQNYTDAEMVAIAGRAVEMAR